MLGNFSYCNPTKLYFGENSLSNLSDELKKYGDNVVLVYGTGSIKKNGIYDDIIKILKESNKNITEIEGVMPNPTVEKLYEGIEIARNHNADFILAVGGGSVCDFSKALSVSVNCNVEKINILKFCAKLERIVAVFFTSSPFPMCSVSVFNVS